MESSQFEAQRRTFLAGLVAAMASVPFAAPARAAGLGGGITGLLANASDTSLDKLAVPGAFYSDTAIRIALPLLGLGGGLGGALGSVMGATDKLGLTDGITRKLNDAAGQAAAQAKPIFRSAISRLQITDVPGLVSQSDGGTQYLKRTAGTDLHARVRPLIDAALVKVGAFRQFDALSKQSSLLSTAGLTHDKLGNSVTEQALKGIFQYIGAEEGRLRANPLGKAGSLLNGALKF
ncbi:DUF4197 family protein [Novosphingobium lentum]|uniref:DUF4197 family protein n=1 Tax=Novosphingobium lentum TaxID=145287 RepID=UPI0008307EE3|nr:DUF4197 family protein [Novosphingobium lentum]